MSDYQNTPTVDDQLQKARPPFRRVSSLRYSADPCREEMETARGVQIIVVVVVVVVAGFFSGVGKLGGQEMKVRRRSPGVEPRWGSGKPTKNCENNV